MSYIILLCKYIDKIDKFQVFKLHTQQKGKHIAQINLAKTYRKLQRQEKV